MSVFRKIMLSGGISSGPPKTRKLYYTATAKVNPTADSLGSSIISNTWDSNTGKGVIECVDYIEVINNKAFYNKVTLVSITIPHSVTSIGNEAFYGCENLKSVTIPNSVTSIGEYTFAYCGNLTSVYCKPTTPPAGGSEDMFNYYVSGLKIYVPRNSVDAYKSASFWSDYASDIVGYDF